MKRDTTQDETLARQVLHDGWRLRSAGLAADAPIRDVDVVAQVPGAVHLDLMEAGLIPDPYLDRNEEEQHWIARSDWRFECSAPLPGRETSGSRNGARVDLVFDGLDTVAEIAIDGTVIGRTANQHRRYRFDVTGLIDKASVAGRSTIEVAVTFAAPSTWAEQQRDQAGDLPTTYDAPFNFIRKMACNFGWDWGPRLTTSGIWRAVAFETWSGARMAAVRPTATVAEDGTGRLSVEVDLERAAPSGEPLQILVGVAGVETSCEVTSGETSVSVALEAPAVQRWWPAGYGEQALYDLSVELTTDGRTLDEHQSRVGFRNVAIDTTAVDDGSRWAITVNGERIWVRGVNWIPDDCFPARVDRERIAHRLDQARAANVNLIRVWGGGLYESDDFYEICDEQGLLVWQDFLFACATYDEELLGREVREEAADNIDRLMGHPSLVLWNGNNENLWGWWAWGWPELVGDRSWGEGFYRELLPALVAERDPARPYIEGSPSSGPEHPDRHPNDQDHGPMHIWTVWNEVDYLHYRDFNPRFVAEFGYQAPPTYETLSAAVTSRPLTLNNPDLAHHQKADNGQAKLDRGLATHFADPEVLSDPARFDDWLYLTQLNQARALTVGIGHLRRLHQRCSGAVLWQLNDCWPAVSWSVLDGEGRQKPSWYALRTVFADRLLVIEPDGDGLAVFPINDSDRPWTGALLVRRIGTDGRIRAERSFEVNVEPRRAGKLLLPADVGSPGEPNAELVVADLEDCRAVHSWAVDRDLTLAAPRFQLSVERSTGTTEVQITAETLIRDLCLFPDRVDPHATVDSQLVTLLPGEHHSFVVNTELTIDDAELGAPPILTSVNHALGR